MTRDTRGIRIGCAGFVLLTLAAGGCAQQGQSNARPMRSSAAASVAKAAAAAAPASPLLATAQAASNVVNAAAGAVTGAINGAVAGAGGTPATATTTTQKKVPRIKPDGRGGYDASELQADAIARAHAMTARYGVTGYSKITGRPTPSTQPSGN